MILIIQKNRLITANNLPAVISDKGYQYSIDDFYFQDPIALSYQLELISDFLISNKSQNVSCNSIGSVSRYM
ncbi:hypothetical protein C1I59_16520 [Paenibacillus polymyxa]|nr:hypothetical protein C0638_16290 [Paenibacillus sp. lzh-N1]QOH62997.1 hypothetical protein DI243_16960 [Paenibacillus polymyxa]TKH35486.1 hypothetical protein C1I59_16520 [Paenibacillus polymyxa]